MSTKDDLHRVIHRIQASARTRYPEEIADLEAALRIGELLAEWPYCPRCNRPVLAYGPPSGCRCQPYVAECNVPSKNSDSA